MKLKIDRTAWKKVRLGDVAFEYSKRINNPSESDFDRFVGSSNIDQWDFRVKSWETTDSVTSAMKLFEPNDYLLVRRSLYASDFRERAPRAHFGGVCSGDIITIKENPEFIVDGFLIGILNSQSLWKFVVANASGSITRRIKWKDLANYEFILPPKDQQAQLAELLWAMDEVIQGEINVQKEIEKLQDTLETKIREAYFDKSIEAEIEEGVVEGRLDSFFLLQRGFDLTKKNAVSGDVPVVSSSGVSYYHNESKCEPPGVVTGRKGNIGGVYFLNEPYWPHDTSLWVKDFKGNEARFVYWFLNSINLEIFNAATAVPTLNRNVLHPISVRFPSIETQREICERLDMVNCEKKRINESIHSAKSLQKSLINQVV